MLTGMSFIQAALALIKVPGTVTRASVSAFRESMSVSSRQKWRILKNVFVIAMGFLFVFIAFEGNANLQSSINAQAGLGATSLGTIYAALLISCMFLPTLVIRTLSAKWTIVVSMICYIPFLAFQLYPKFYTLIPAAILLGLGAAPMWTSHSTYITQVGQVYARMTRQPTDEIIVRFFGFFFLAWQTSDAWGNLISSLVLNTKDDDDDDDNNTMSLEGCGADFCHDGETGHKNIQRPAEREMILLTAIYVGFICAGILIIALFLDPLGRYGEGSVSDDELIHEEYRGLNLFMATFRQLGKLNQLLLIPITIFNGMQQAFTAADFTQAYIACVLGVENIGYVMICFGIVNGSASIVFGVLVRYTGRYFIMAFGAITHFTVIAMLLFWEPKKDMTFFFTVAALWAAADSIWQIQLNGIYGTLFSDSKEPAFSNYRLWEATGFVITYSYHMMCAKIKEIILLSTLSFGMFCYVIVEIRYSLWLRKHGDEY